MMPAARAGQTLWRSRIRTRGLKMIARTVANISGSTISLTAANATNTMMLATTNPTKLHAHTPNLGTLARSAGT
jgi:hypothetical protein